MDTKAFYKMSYGLYIVSTSHNGKDYGCIVNTLAQITSTPAQMSVAINKENYTSKMIDKNGYITATSLSIDAPMELIGTFGFKSGKDINKFDGLSFVRDQNGIAYVTQHTNAVFNLKVSRTIDVGTHKIYIADVLDAKPLNDDESLTYAYYQTVKKGKTPPKASSYNASSAPDVKESNTESKVRYICKICGYIYTGDPLPEDFICPICGHPASDFERIN